MERVAKKINIPENILEKEKYASLPALQKEEYLHNLLREILKLNAGVTVSDIRKNSYISHTVIWHHLEIMSSRGECLRIERGDTDVYHLNEVIDHLGEFDIIDDKSSYHFGFNFDIVENPFGKFLLIQRMRESRSDAHTIRGGVIVPSYLLGTLIDTITKIRDNHLKEDKDENTERK